MSHSGESAGSGSTTAPSRNAPPRWPSATGSDHGRFVDDGPARDVDHDGAARQQPQPPAARAGLRSAASADKHKTIASVRAKHLVDCVDGHDRAGGTPPVRASRDTHDLGTQRGEDFAGLPADMAEADDGNSSPRELPGGVPLPRVRGLPPGKLRQLLHEVQHAGERELRERDRVHAGRGGERDVAVAESRPVDELPIPELDACTQRSRGQLTAMCAGSSQSKSS